MNRSRHIIALLLGGLYLLVLLHNIIPHHHQQDVKDKAAKTELTHGHSHGHHHHHHHHDPKASLLNVLFSFLNHFTHQSPGEKHLEVYTPAKFAMQKPATETSVADFKVAEFLFREPEPIMPDIPAFESPPPESQIHTCCDPLRGPPAMLA